MKEIRYSDDILVYENFLTPEECQKVIDTLNLQVKNETMTWTPITFYESYSSNLPSDNDPEILECGLPGTFFSDTEQRIIDATAKIHNKDPKQMSKIGYHTQKWEEGAYATIHADNSYNDGSPSPFERSRYATFIYLNDDFEGGILNFPERNIQIKPKTGLLAAFAGDYTNLHEVTIITKGTRYTLGYFWDDKEESDYPEETREKWKQEMEDIRKSQEETKAEWKGLLEEGYKIDPAGVKYRIEENH